MQEEGSQEKDEENSQTKQNTDNHSNSRRSSQNVPEDDENSQGNPTKSSHHECINIESSLGNRTMSKLKVSKEGESSQYCCKTGECSQRARSQTPQDVSCQVNGRQSCQDECQDEASCQGCMTNNYVKNSPRSKKVEAKREITLL
jgi:hypothetical protein